MTSAMMARAADRRETQSPPTPARVTGLAPVAGPAPVVDVVLPVYNEAAGLECSVLRLHAFLGERFPLSFRITIADNASTDGTWAAARRLEAGLPHVAALHLDEKGRGRALKAAWMHSDATVLAYMDIDLATDLAALLPLVAPLVSGHSDLAIGTRLARTSVVVRAPKREFISRCYNRLTQLALGAGFSDAQCGFKAIRAECAGKLLPWVKDDGWFFDTELLAIAERAGMRIHEVPVDWTDDPDSRVEIVPTAIADLKGIARLRRAFARGCVPLAALGGGRAVQAAGRRRGRLFRQLVSFGLIGVASTLAYAVLYLALREVMAAQAANALSLLLTALANTAANRRITFGVRGTGGRLRHQSQGLVVFALGLTVTSGSLLLLRRYDPVASHGVELAVLIAASVIATLLRFVLFRAWIFPQRHVRPTTALR
jgi:putative flippase GtrA